jgi:serpin B
MQENSAMSRSPSVRLPRDMRSSKAACPRQLRLEPLEDRRMLAGRATEAINDFALDVYEQMQREAGNLFFSPLSVATGLAMAYAGAAGQTAAEMEQVLRLGSEPGIHASFGDLLDSIASHNDWFTLHPTITQFAPILRLANAMWPDNSLSVKQSFLEVIQNDYYGHVQNVDYSNSAQAEGIINQWVSQHTFGKIPNLISNLDPSVVMVLTNAVYFNGYWERPFDPKHTALQPFTLANGQTIMTPTMYTDMIDSSYTRIDGYDVLELPFEHGAKDADYSMVFVLPPASGAGYLTPELCSKIDAWLDGPPFARDVIITLPKIDTAVSTSFEQLLIGLGMPTAFALGAADFSGMTSQKTAIGEVFHKATLTMNEQGTTAAAATEVSFVICFAAGTPVMTPQGPKPIEELQQGDLVLARDENNVEGELQPKRVEKVFRREGETLELRIRGQVSRTTDTHPF